MTPPSVPMTMETELRMTKLLDAPVGAPIWMLDVDGVLNAVTGKDLPGYKRKTLNGFPIQWDPAIVQRIRQVHDDGVEIRWLTTWGRLANQHISEPLGLPIDLEVVREPDYIPSRRWFKLEAVMNFRATNPNVPLIWTDDDIRYEQEARLWLDSEEAHSILAIYPTMAVGLTHDHLSFIEGWVAGQRYRMEAHDPRAL